MPPPPARHNVLLVEDDLDTGEILSEIIRQLGHRVVHVDSGEAAVAAAEAFDPDVILVDLTLPGDMDGCAVARRLREWAGRRRPAIHALTGWSRPEDVARVRAAGFDRFLTKPISLEQLLELLAPRQVSAFGRRRTDA